VTVTGFDGCAHIWATVERLDHCEIDVTDPILHTSVVVLGCQRCRTVDLFPSSNAALLTPRYVEELRERLFRRGWILPDGIQWGPKEDRPSFTCPRCGRMSYNPHDIVEQYCGACHAFIDD
jgi:hypothetical protein